MIKKCFSLILVILLLSQVSTFPIHCIEKNILLEDGDDNNLTKRQVTCSPTLQDQGMTVRPTMMSEEDKKKLQARLFEGLLHFGTIVNHIDNFIMEKGKVVLKSLGKMAASDEDKRFEM